MRARAPAVLVPEGFAATVAEFCRRVSLSGPARGAGVGLKIGATRRAKPAADSVAEPQLQQRPGSGGTYPPALRAMCSSIIFHASSVILYCQ